MKQLIHYTRSAATVGSILRHGFLLIPNARELLTSLVEDRVDWSEEPQETGMVSFTEVPWESSAAHRVRYGEFGVAVSWEWAVKHGVERVIYVRDEGPIFELWRNMFTSAHGDVQRRERDGPMSWGGSSIRNRVLAQTVGASAWATMLRFYEFMQPYCDSAQAEWRIVNRLPYHFVSRDKEAQIREALAQAERWQTANVRVTPADVEYVTCPREATETILQHLPVEFARCKLNPSCS